MKYFYSVIFLIIISSDCSATIEIKQLNGYPLTHYAGMMEMVFDYITGDMYVTSKNATYTISRIRQTSGFNTVIAEPIPLDAMSEDCIPRHLSYTHLLPNVTCVVYEPQIYDLDFDSKVILYPTRYISLAQVIDFQNDPIVATSDIIKDANGQDCSGIVAVVAAGSLVFVAVAPKDGLWGEIGSGIAVLKINYIPATHTESASFSLVQVNQVINNDNKIMAYPLDITCSEIARESYALLSPDTLKINNAPSVYWSKELQRLYVGMKEVMSGFLNQDVAKSVAVFKVNSDNILSSISLMATEEWGDAHTDKTSNYVGVKSSLSPLSIHHLKTLVTSTGRHYLILHGGNGKYANTASNVVALPLVNHNNAESNTQGSLASVDNVSNVIDFSRQAKNHTELLNYNNSQIKPIVGFDLPPVASPSFHILDNNLNDSIISDIHATFNTVYMAAQKYSKIIKHESEMGIFFSHPVFDESGAVLEWTIWQKSHYKPFQIGYKLQQCAVNPYSGQVFSIESNDFQDVLTSHSWNNTLQNSSLSSAITQLFSDRLPYCFLCPSRDNTQSQAKAQLSRYAIFGAVRKIVFFRIGLPPQIGTDYIDRSIRMPVDNYLDKDNYIVTELPQEASNVYCLGYFCTRNFEKDTFPVHYNNPDNDILNNTLIQCGGYDKSQHKERVFILSGTEYGLYAYGHGFIFEDFYKTLQDVPFSEKTWSRVRGINGSVRKIKTIGNDVYILAHDNSNQSNIRDILYKIAKNQITLNGLSSPNKQAVLARSSVDVLQDVNTFKDIVILSKDNINSDVEQVILFTSNGVYVTNASNGINNVGFGDKQNEAQWQLINFTLPDGSMISSKSIFFENVYPHDYITGIARNHTFWITHTINVDESHRYVTVAQIYVSRDSSNRKYFFTPSQGVLNDELVGSGELSLKSIIDFVTDGNRRFFIAYDYETFSTKLYSCINTSIVHKYYPIISMVQHYIRNPSWIVSTGMGHVLVATDNAVQEIQ